jgi:hypothetical protein
MAESTVNQVISKRFVKKPQMKWTKRGAHLLLQVRTHVLLPLDGVKAHIDGRWQEPQVATILVRRLLSRAWHPG